ncbi:MAG: TonB family protein [Acidobacteriales bacterium]|nr:TonB family protein [Terriglobales bacterium]
MRLLLVLAALPLLGQIPATKPGLILVPSQEPTSRVRAEEPLPIPPEPRFTLEGVVRFQANKSRLFAPGTIVTVYGENLAPATWCGVELSQKPPYPLEVCGVRVLVGESPAGLLYAGPKQINLMLPADAPTLGTAPMRVCVREVCSDPVELRFSVRKIFLKMDGKAYVHMPLWIDVEHPTPYEFLYPCMNRPGAIVNASLEVRYGGRPLAARAQPMYMGRILNGSSCMAAGRSSEGRVPLHMLYPIDRPGVYSVKLTTYGETLCESDWMDVVVEPFSAALREGWLRSIDERIEAATAEELAAAILPNLLSYPDEKVLMRVARLTRHRNRMVSEFARQSLAIFDEEIIRRTISAERLAELCPPRGRCRAEAPDSLPIVQQKVAPEYTDEARRVGREGAVLLRVQVDASGQVVSTSLMRSLGLGLDEKAFEAVKKWKFAPGTMKGQPVGAEILVAVEFRL